MEIKEGLTAPDFSLETDSNQRISLSDFKGKKVVVYFYPKDDTPGCTTEACDFRDNTQRLTALNVVVLGISKDSVAKHLKFKDKHNLPFILASDEEGRVCDLYGVFKEKSMYGKTFLGIERSTFLINEDGIISKIWRKVKVKGHIEEIIKTISEI